MTWYFDPSGTTMDVYDHNGDVVVSDYEFGGAWSGDYPTAVLDVMYEEMSDSQSNYNQQTLRCGALERIREGTPPA